MTTDNPPITWTWGPTVAVDFEAYYDDEITLKKLGNWHYTRHPKVDPFLVSVFDGENLWVGCPKKFDWKGLDGRQLLSHNASYDEEAYLAGVERGHYAKIDYRWHCTADIAIWYTGYRDLLNTVQALFGYGISKQVRADAKEKQRSDLEAEGSWDDMVRYAGDDAKWCWKIWERLGTRWPEREKRISVLNRERGRYGVAVDVPELKRCVSLVRRVVIEAEDALPWVKAGRKAGSPIGVAEECRKSGIPCPPVKSGPNGDPEEAEEWLENYGSKLPWVKALKDLRRGKKMLATLERMESRLREEPSGDVTLPFSLLYWGAHTGRFAGTGGINFQNFNKEPMFTEHDPLGKGVDVRGMLIPRKGKRFAIVDLSQIEPRCLNYLIGNEALLSKIRGGMAIYEAFARASMGWKGGKLKKESKYLYNLAKAQVLALGYGAGWKKFISMALQPMYGNLDLCADDDKVALEKSLDKKFYVETESVVKDIKTYRAIEYNEAEHRPMDRFVVVQGPEGIPVRENVYGINARKIVQDFRDSNPLIVGLWNALDEGIRQAAAERRDFEFELPDGSTLKYRNCRFEKRRKIDKETGEAYTKTEVRFDLGIHSEGTYGGKLTENGIQMFGRNVFVEGTLRVEDTTSAKTLFTVHDEAVTEVDDDGTPLFEIRDGREVRVTRNSAEDLPDDTVLWKVVTAFSKAPEWAPTLPVAAEGVWADRYLK